MLDISNFIYLYTVVSILLTIIFITLKCKYNFNKLDDYLYTTSIDNIYKYIIYHIVPYILLGIIFGKEYLLLTIIRIIIIELSLIYVEKCDMKEIKIDSGIYSIILSIIGYLIGVGLILLWNMKITYNKLMNYLVTIYIISSIGLTILYLFAKCYYNFDYFDSILYKKEGDEKILNYILFHVVYYLILGLIFGMNEWQMSIIQTIIIEFLIAYVERCDYKNINYMTGIYSILIGLTSYFAGGLFSYYMFGIGKK